MEFKGTKGEWRVRHSESKKAWNVVGTALGRKYKIARCPYVFDEALSDSVNSKENEETKSNAQLIAVSPDLLKFAQFIAKHEKGCAPSCGYFQEMIEKAENVINKALGEK